MSQFFLFLIVILMIYLLVTLIVGRYLLYQDIFPRKIPNGKTELVGYDYKDMEFKGFDGITLRGWFIRSPRNPSNKTVFLLPGWTRVRSKYINQIKFFVDSGFHVFTYDQRSSDSFMRFMEKVKEPKVIWVHAGRHTSSYNQYPEEYGDKVIGFLNKCLGVV